MGPRQVVAAAAPLVAAQRPILKMALVGLVVVSLWIVTTFLVRLHRAERRSRAVHQAALGRSDQQAERTSRAVAHFREAAALDPSELTYRLSLGRALLAAGRLDEAAGYLRDVLRDNPVNGPANLLLARIQRARDLATEAEALYYRAIYGLWPADEQQTRVEARLELIELLRKTSDRERVRAELTQLASAFPGDLTLQLRVARYLLDLDYADDAARLFRLVATRYTESGQALAGLAEAEVARGDYAAAAGAAARAVRRDPQDRASIERRDLAMTALALDPTQPRLESRERSRRIEVLLRLARARLAACEKSARAPTARPELRGLVDTWLAGRERPARESLDLGFSLAESLAREVVARCPSAAEHRGLDLVLRKLGSATRS